MPAAEHGREDVSAATVRPLYARDIDAMLMIAAEAPEASSWSKDSYAKLLDDSNSLGLAAEWGGELVGFLVGQQAADQAEVLNLAVKKDHRRRGHASALLAAALEEFRWRGAESVYLEVRQSNAAAISFYSQNGFEISGSRRGYYRDPLEDAVTMTRKFTG
jgi:ribosomal-protein-alanine acetyltransferase